MNPKIIFLCLFCLSLFACTSKQNNNIETTIQPAIQKVGPVENQTKDEDDKYLVIYQSATVYAGSTDYYFENQAGQPISFRVSSIEENIKVPENLLESLENLEGPPGANPEMVGKQFVLIYGESGDLIEIAPKY